MRKGLVIYESQYIFEGANFAFSSSVAGSSMATVYIFGENIIDWRVEAPHGRETTYPEYLEGYSRLASVGQRWTDALEIGALKRVDFENMPT